MKSIKIFVSTLVFVFCSLGLFSQEEVREQTMKFNRLLGLIDAAYVDTVNLEKLVETAIVDMLKEMDPHSVYISSEEIKRMQEPLEGSFDGIGIQFRILDDTLLVAGVISGGPSEKVGLMSGDKIIIVDNDTIAGVGITNSDVAKKLRGKKGTEVIVRVKREGEKELIEFKIIRDKIPIYSVDASYIVDNIGYIKLNKFAKTTEAELDTIFNEFKEKGVRDIILDLSGNTGGYLEKSVKLCDEFLSDDKLIVYTEGAKFDRLQYSSTAAGRYEKGRLVVIVDEGSASASEIVSGAIQDWDRGVVIGRRTFGKGLVQREMLLTDGSAVRLTIARYYTPTGRCIQKPYEEGYDDYSKDVTNRYLHGEFSNRDSIKFADSLKYETFVNKKTVYGGGGIMPDDFIPIDTTLRSDYHIELLRKNVLFTWITKYVNTNRKDLAKNYPDIETFKEKYVVDQKALEDLAVAAADAKIIVDSLQVPTEKQHEYLKMHIKSLIAGDIWENSDFWYIYNDMNPFFIRAKEVISNDNIYNKLIKGK